MAGSSVPVTRGVTQTALRSHEAWIRPSCPRAPERVNPVVNPSVRGKRSSVLTTAHTHTQADARGRGSTPPHGVRPNALRGRTYQSEGWGAPSQRKRSRRSRSGTRPRQLPNGRLNWPRVVMPRWLEKRRHVQLISKMAPTRQRTRYHRGELLFCVASRSRSVFSRPHLCSVGNAALTGDWILCGLCGIRRCHVEQLTGVTFKLRRVI